MLVEMRFYWVCNARETVPKLGKGVHVRFVTPASRRQSSTLQFLFAGGDAGVTKSFGTVSRTLRAVVERCRRARWKRAVQTARQCSAESIEYCKNTRPATSRQHL